MTKALITLNTFQLKEFSKYWFDLSKITFGSLVIKLFEGGPIKFTIGSLLTLLAGLTISAMLVIIGLIMSRGIKKDL